MKTNNSMLTQKQMKKHKFSWAFD